MGPTALVSGAIADARSPGRSPERPELRHAAAPAPAALTQMPWHPGPATDS